MNRPLNLRRGFTLIELLTVIAIIGVLATLLLTALVGAKKRSRQARCTSNLHQIALALNMYLDDLGSRPADLPVLVDTQYLPGPATLLCPEDKTGNWGGLHNFFGIQLIPAAPGADRQTGSPKFTPYSYLHPLSWDDDSWSRLLKSGPSAGIAVCQLHGLPTPGSTGTNGFPSSIQDFEGLVLRAQLDAAVVRRQWFWSANASPPSNPPSIGASMASQAQPPMQSSLYPWPLFTDDPPQ